MSEVRAEDKRLLKPTIRRAKPPFRPGWHLEVPDQGEAHATLEYFDSFEAAVAGLADWWANGKWASFLRYRGSGADRRRAVLGAHHGGSMPECEAPGPTVLRIVTGPAPDIVTWGPWLEHVSLEGRCVCGDGVQWRAEVDGRYVAAWLNKHAGCEVAHA